MATRYANKNKADKYLGHYDLRTAFIRGAEWYKSVTAACASGAVDKTVSDGSCLKSCSPSDWQTKCKENGCNTE